MALLENETRKWRSRKVRMVTHHKANPMTSPTKQPAETAIAPIRNAVAIHTARRAKYESGSMDMWNRSSSVRTTPNSKMSVVVTVEKRRATAVMEPQIRAMPTVKTSTEDWEILCRDSGIIEDEEERHLAWNRMRCLRIASLSRRGTNSKDSWAWRTTRRTKRDRMHAPITRSESYQRGSEKSTWLMPNICAWDGGGVDVVFPGSTSS
mmetsp:Transcript_27273/g.47064  ORF Transcript_27273/g.47064 Transcript_27273/m.47064 type:complete len:208 (-) Transcript_27273:9-632(-)